MMRSGHRRMVVLVAVAAAGIAMPVPVPAEPAPKLPSISEEDRKLELADLEGAPRRPLECAAGIEANVVIFVTVDCPIANAYQPAIRRIGDKFVGEGISIMLVQVDPDVDATEAKRHAGEYGIKVPVVLDPEHAAVLATGATITPEAVVVLPGGDVVYRGRISDLYSDLGKRRREARTAELEQAIEAVLSGALPEVRSAPAVGCIIADFKKAPESP